MRKSSILNLMLIDLLKGSTALFTVFLLISECLGVYSLKIGLVIRINYHEHVFS